jgi:dihydrofolate synthase/folylpolyglutamate synthase
MARTLDQWVDYIQTLHPRSIDLSLERVKQVWDSFKPERMPPVIAIAGTNGKGSSVSMLESIYRHAGYRTAAFTSPHLVCFNERICLNNSPVCDRVLLDSFERIELLRGSVTLTFFEFNTLLALDIFCHQGLDVIILEVGMGGRLDAVNAVDSDLALITSIDIDHAAWLGSNREQIGAEKAGIIKAHGRAVLADPDAPQSLAETARAQDAEFVQAGIDYQVNRPSMDATNICFESTDSQLKVFNGFAMRRGLNHMLDNTAGVIAVIAMLQASLPVNIRQLSDGLDKQHLPGRLQIIEGQPRMLLDVSHNEASVLSMIEFIDSLHTDGRIHAVFGALVDKHYGVAYDALKLRISAWYLAGLKGERGHSAEALSATLFTGTAAAHCATDVGLFDSPERAFTEARARAEPADLIVIFGSFHVVGAIIPHLDQ